MGRKSPGDSRQEVCECGLETLGKRVEGKSQSNVNKTPIFPQLEKIWVIFGASG